MQAAYAAMRFLLAVWAYARRAPTGDGHPGPNDDSVALLGAGDRVHDLGGLDRIARHQPYNAASPRHVDEYGPRHDAGKFGHVERIGSCLGIDHLVEAQSVEAVALIADMRE